MQLCGGLSRCPYGTDRRRGCRQTEAGSRRSGAVPLLHLPWRKRRYDVRSSENTNAKESRVGKSGSSYGEPSSANVPSAASFIHHKATLNVPDEPTLQIQRLFPLGESTEHTLGESSYRSSRFSKDVNLLEDHCGVGEGTLPQCHPSPRDRSKHHRPGPCLRIPRTSQLQVVANYLPSATVRRHRKNHRPASSCQARSSSKQYPTTPSKARRACRRESDGWRGLNQANLALLGSAGLLGFANVWELVLLPLPAMVKGKTLPNIAAQPLPLVPGFGSS